MRIFLKFFGCILIPLVSISQNASLSKCWRYEINCSHDVHLNHSVQSIKNQPDTSYQLSIEEVIHLNDFLDAHQLNRSQENPDKGFDIRVVFLFGDNTGERHELGFDCDGNYELDGISYAFSEKIAKAFYELKIGNNEN